MTLVSGAVPSLFGGEWKLAWFVDLKRMFIQPRVPCRSGWEKVKQKVDGVANANDAEIADGN